MKERLDVLLVKRGLAPSREKAKTMIMEGNVFVENQREDKAGATFDTEAEITVKGNTLKYVSRGGLKLEKAMTHFGITLEGKVCMDIGASTGGFTDCMLLTPKETILEEERTVAIKEEGSTKHYYVYVKGNVVLATDDVTEAVTAANDSMGVVIGDNLQYVWKRSRKSAQPALPDIAVGAEDPKNSFTAAVTGLMLIRLCGEIPSRSRVVILSRTTLSSLERPIRYWFCNSSPTARMRLLPR